MEDNQKPTPVESANLADFVPVCICFEDETINEIFSALLEARGIHTRILSDIQEAGQNSKVITEPQYFPKLDPTCQTKCLLVGNKDRLSGTSALALSRPLTEEKIEQALSQFLRM